MLTLEYSSSSIMITSTIDAIDVTKLIFINITISYCYIDGHDKIMVVNLCNWKIENFITAKSHPMITKIPFKDCLKRSAIGGIL